MITASKLKEKVRFTGIELDELEKAIDEGLLKSTLIYEESIEVILSGEYSKEIRNTIAKKYIELGGYSKVDHITSSENGERSGLTTFKFYFK